MKSQFEATVITEQERKIAVVSVQPAIFQNSMNAGMVIKALLPVFPGLPVVLMTVDQEGNPAYYGRSDLVLLLENVNIKEATWNEVSAEIELNNSTCPTKDE